MSMKSQYEEYRERREILEKRPKSELCLNQESRYRHPFQIFGPVWYVGDSWVCVHLIDTGEGLLLIDSGNCGATAMLVQAIWEAGFNPADVKWIIHSHGHLDHVGGAVFFRRMFGTQILMGEPDARMFQEAPWVSLIQESGDLADSVFPIDEVIREGDVKTFGKITMEFKLVPGHTAGCIACFFDVSDGTQTVRAGYYGGFGFNTLTKENLREMGDPTYLTRQVYLNSLAKVRKEKVELFLGNHCINNDTWGRREKQLANPKVNPFIDSQAWGNYLDEKRDALLAFMADPQNN